MAGIDVSIDPVAFRVGMRRLAGHVCLVTSASGAAQRSGLTATAVASVSADPPTLLVCINRSSGTHDVILGTGIFAVNVLALDDQPLANRFASKVAGEERFREGLWRTLDTGAPILESALVSFDCQVAQAVSVGTHGIFFGAIKALHVRQPEAKPLLYVHGAYGGFASFGESISPEILGLPAWGSLES